MSAVPPSQGIYIGEGADASFGVFHASANGARRGIAVLLCPPFGWEDFCSFRSRRTWAEQLAAAGYPALRIDLPGCGDSGGSPRDPALFATWSGSVAAAAGWLRARTGCGRVAAIGIGIGGMVAVHATSSGAAIDDLVLWATPARGRSAVRELRAFARLNATEVDPADAIDVELAPSEPLPDGSLEVAGFLLNAETLDGLGALDLTTLPLPDGSGRRVLMIERDRIAPDQRLRDHFESRGAKVSVVPGPGYAAMMDHPQEAVAPRAELAAVIGWLAAGPEPSAPGDGMDPDIGEQRLELRVGGIGIRETPLTVDQPFGRLAGVLSEPLAGPPAEVCVVLLNAGALRRIGPGRMWVDLARRWAARGVPTLRIDLCGIGDSDGDSTPYVHTAALYSLGLVDQVLATLDELEKRGLPSRFVLGGLCSGAFWAFHAALRDRRVSAAFLLNPRALFWDETIEDVRNARRIARLFSVDVWRRLIRGRIPLAQVGVVLRAALTKVVRPRLGSGDRRARAGELESALAQLQAADQRILLAFGGREPLYEELERDGQIERVAHLPNVDLTRIPGSDHTLRPIATQQLVAAVLDRALERELGPGR